MPDLSSKGVHKFWHEYPDPAVYKVISFMESVENWSLDDNPELEKSVAALGVALDNVGFIDLQSEAKLIQMSVYIKMGRALRLLQCLDIAHPGAASKILMFAKNVSSSADDDAGVFLRRNVVFERLRLLERIFSKERLAAVKKVLGEKKHA